VLYALRVRSIHRIGGRGSAPWRTTFLAVLLLLSLLPFPHGQAASKQLSWQKLLEQSRKAVAAAPQDPDKRYELAMIYAHEGRVFDAWDELKEVDRLVGGEARRKSYAQRIIAASATQIKRSPGDILARYKLAFAYYFIGRRLDARREFHIIVDLEPRHSWSYGYLGYLYAEAGNLDKAIALWEKGVKFDPGNAVLHYVLGVAYVRKGDMKRAAQHFVDAYKDRTLYEYVKGK